MTTALQDTLFDCDWIPYDVFEQDMTFDDGRLALRDEQYRVLIVPAVETIPYATLVKVKDYYRAGGVVISRPPRDGRMAFVRSPDLISIELLQRGASLPSAEPWASMPNTGSW
jgi:hypothetical protein